MVGKLLHLRSKVGRPVGRSSLKQRKFGFQITEVEDLGAGRQARQRNYHSPLGVRRKRHKNKAPYASSSRTDGTTKAKGGNESATQSYHWLANQMRAVLQAVETTIYANGVTSSSPWLHGTCYHGFNPPASVNPNGVAPGSRRGEAEPTLLLGTVVSPWIEADAC